MKRCLTVLSIVIIAINKVKGRNVSGISTHYFGSKFLMISMLHSHIERERERSCMHHHDFDCCLPTYIVDRFSLFRSYENIA